MPKFEVRYIYTGSRVYEVEAETREEAKKNYSKTEPVKTGEFDPFIEITEK